MQDEATVSAADIARLAGVGRAAVSNWRRRHPDFPQPVGGTPTSPVFALADVEAWLRDQHKLDELPLEERVWQRLRAEAPDDLRVAEVLADAGELLLDHHAAGAPRAGRSPEPLSAETARAVTELAAARGAVAAFEFLFGRYRETQARRVSATPPEIPALMAALAGDARTVLDPACGTGDLLLAMLGDSGEPRRLLGQDADGDVTRLAAVRLTLRSADAGVREGDSLRQDAFPGVLADAVLCDPPFHERAWGHEELRTDPRWEYGLPPRLEPELAWVQHALAHLGPGGRAVVLMPAVAAGRRSGRRIRAELLRKGALRAVAGLSATHHLWMLRPPEDTPPATVLMIDSADPETVVATWRRHADDPGHDEPGVSRAVPVIDLLDEEVDLTPSRHVSPTRTDHTAERFTATHDRLTATLGKAGRLVPALSPAAERREARSVPLSELARIGYLTIHQAPMRGDTEDGGGDDPPLLTAEDVAEGRAPTGRAARGDTRWIPIQAGDVLVAAVARRFVVRVAETGGPLLGPQLSLLRVDPRHLDPYFIAGVLRSSANARSSIVQSTGTIGRADIRRAQVPRLPLEDQRRYGAAFRRMAEFESALRSTVAMGTELAQLLADGVAEGTLAPPNETFPPANP
ncbi:N-6 DNA methylase [Actinoallomurus rhizosphaericola]|uniref:N-6 DNA methylase n=1 Tax=Actinoallomurus rhizosphaericola TaxID=2952536 RepID=UPI0020901831|nr:N-6 DNA methylase [Actinoallomurus rhizosphaericola]MCO5993731.1 N-6 DNA methylase [Actinoallomurus rhizosphaericola]